MNQQKKLEKESKKFKFCKEFDSMSKIFRTPQKSKQYAPCTKKEKSFKIHRIDIRKTPKHKKEYYNEANTEY